MATGKPIVYTSADSVIQIAAHEETFGLERLYEVCKIARELTYELNIGRVIARPFIGTDADNFTRTGNRKDYAVLPPSAHASRLPRPSGPRRRLRRQDWRHLCPFRHRPRNQGCGPRSADAHFSGGHGDLPAGGFIMTNFVDFDMQFRPPARRNRLWQGAGRL